MNENFWKPYVPSDREPWNAERVVHLHRRAGFAATWREVERDLKDGPKPSIDRFLAGEAAESLHGKEFSALANRLAKTAVQSKRIDRLKAWWLFRMIFTPDPLTERLTLMWHNHFATGEQKVRSHGYMKHQNDVIRRHARADFAELLPQVVRSPAMLIWLDAQANDQRHPNENLARELMELFSLGVGHYTEMDVKEAARALTGWTIKERAFHFDSSRHDSGRKTILGHAGNWNGDDLLKILLEHPATSERIAFRLCELFLGEGVASETAITEQLAKGLRKNRLNIAWAVETVLRSELFFSEKNIGNRPLSPIEFVVGAVRVLEPTSRNSSTLLLAEWSEAMGQDLFQPPSVFGWPGGRAWLTTRTLIARANFAHAMTSGATHSRQEPIPWKQLAEQHEAADFQELRDTLYLLLTGQPSKERAADQAETKTEQAMNSFITSVLASPAAQLA